MEGTKMNTQTKELTKMEEIKMTTASEIQEIINHSTGSSQYFKYGYGLLLTEGVKEVCEQGCHWIVDIIASTKTIPLVRKELFQHWVLQVDLEKASGVITCDDGNGNKLYGQDIPFTDFPLKKISFYFVDNVVMLVGEY